MTPALQCARCHTPLDDSFLNRGGLSPCPSCGVLFEIETFPALFRPLPRGIDGEPVMVIKSDATTTTVAIVGNGQLLLFRTLENPSSGPPKAEQLAEDVHSSMVFFEDTYNMRVSRILVAGSLEAENVGPALESQTNVRVQDLVASRHIGAARPNFPASALAGVVGALLG